jgi:hypothetical protein
VAEDKDKVLEWSICPFKENTAKSFFFVTILGCLVFLIYSWFNALLPTVIIGGLFLLALRSFYTRTRYVFYPDRLEIITPFSRGKKAWSGFRSYYPDKNGVLLSPFEKPSRLENFRGMYLLLPAGGGQREQVLDYIKQKITNINAKDNPDERNTKQT